jgi:uncharacterized membrane protein YdbT with pleckstrin-like domain
MQKINKIICFIFSLLLSVSTFAQQIETEPQMADTFRSEGKINVVIAVISIIFICLAAYLIIIDLKLKKIEKNK